MSFKLFGDLSDDSRLAIGSEYLGEFPKGAYDAMGRLVEYDCLLLICQKFETGAAPFLHRKEALEVKTVAGKSAVDKSRHKGCGTRQTFNIDTRPPAFAAEREAGSEIPGVPASDINAIVSPPMSLSITRATEVCSLYL